MNTKMHVIEASQKTKSELIAILFPRERWGYIEPNIPEKLWIENGGDCHPPLFVWDKETKKPINIIKHGLEAGIFWQTNSAELFR